jgi:nitrogen fixation/metabolism regulation signal transduction histidine kinase
VNPGATRNMRLPMSAYIGRLLNDEPGLEAYAKAVGERYDLHADSPEPGERDLWQESFDVQTQASRDNVTLLVRGAPLPAGARLMVFDDITELVSAQRSEAWSEVARRLAHEIKNPLTPIQLSAERIEHKLAPKLTGADQAMLQRSVATIVNQVHSMKQLVNEFRDYARLPSARLTPLDLNALVGEVLALYANEQEGGRLRADTSPDLPLIVGDATQLRQVIHNLVQNGLDAVSEQKDGHVCVHTEVTRNEQHEPRSVRLHVIDNGHGFPEKVLKRAFEPYVTTKTKGTGLGLAVVKKIADEHGARVRISNLPPAAPPASPQQGDSTTSNALAEAAVAASHEGGQGAVHGGAQVSLSFSKLATVEASNQEATQKHAGTH